MVGPEVVSVMDDLYAGKCQMESLNKVYLILIPKTAGAEYIGDFRTISLSNLIHLNIAKVLANHLHEVLDGLISPFQSTFIPGRQMIDSVVLAEEMVAAWRQSGTADFMWKVDFAKADNSIVWQFLWNVLRRCGFLAEWVCWVKLYVTTTSFSVLVNGRAQGRWFQPERGIRQGCPLAPLLSILAADALAICTTRMCSRGYLSGFQTAGTPDGILLLQYADDTTFFIQGSETATRTLSSMMDIFSYFFGLQLNRANSICGFRALYRGGVKVRQTSSNTDQDTPCPVFGSVNFGRQVLEKVITDQDTLITRLCSRCSRRWRPDWEVVGHTCSREAAG